jgi:hypothetical protein
LIIEIKHFKFIKLFFTTVPKKTNIYFANIPSLLREKKQRRICVQDVLRDGAANPASSLDCFYSFIEHSTSTSRTG